MDLDQLQSKLLDAAKKLPANERVPCAFSVRVMAQLGARPSEDSWLLWNRSLWKAAAASVAFCLMLHLWPFASLNDPSPLTLETTLVSMAQQLSDSW